jgi:hypothetical protein
MNIPQNGAPHNSASSGNQTPPKPRALAVQADDIPIALRRRNQWLTWRYEYRPDRNASKPWTKPPFQVNGSYAKTTDPQTWTSFDQVLEEVAHFDGIGFAFSEQDPYVGVDLDHCRDPLDGSIEPWVQDIIERLDSYTEVTPSGTGIRIIIEGQLPPGGRKKGDFEVYQTGRFETITGHHLEGTPLEIRQRQSEIEAIHAEVFKLQDQPHQGNNGKGPDGYVPPNLSDTELLAKAFSARNGAKVARLYFGDISGYASKSEADFALLGCLAFWTGPDPVQLDRLFRGSKLFEAKWDVRHYTSGETYGEHAVVKAIEGTTEFYHPGGSNYSSSEPEEPWPELGELPQVSSPPSLPADMIPACLRPWIEDIARQGCFPLAMVAIPAIEAASAIIGRKLAIRPWQFSDYSVIPNLWGAVVARPSTMKSYAIDQGIKPLKRLAATARDRFQAEEAVNEANRLAIEAELDAIKSDMQAAAKGKPPPKNHPPLKDMAALKEEYAKKRQELDDARPTEHRYWVTDTTPEKLGLLLIDNPNGLLVSYDELTGWLGDMEKPGREGSRAFYLSGWEGVGDYYTDRVVRGTNYIPAVCLSVIGGIQPDRLQHYIDEAFGGGNGGDGMIQRFQLLVKIDYLGEWEPPTAWPDTLAKQRAFEVFKWLDETNLAGLGRQDSAEEVSYVRFSPDAQGLADQWHDELETRLRGQEFQDMPTFEAHIGKYRSLMPSLALIFHLLDQSVSGVSAIPIDFLPVDFLPEKFSVSPKAVALAADWCDFLELHARAIYQAEVTPGVEAAGRLAKKIAEGRIHHGDPVRDIYRHQWSGLTTSAVVSSGLEVLESAGWVEIVMQHTGVNPITVVHLHPELREAPHV